MSANDDEMSDFEKRTRALLEESVSRTDGRIRSRLNQARHAALAQLQPARRRPFWRSFTLAPAAGVVAAVVLALFLILSRTRLGLRIRAGTLDLETVSVLGVNVRVLRNLNFGIGIYLAGLAGVLAAGMLGLQPTVGDKALSAFAVRTT